MLHRESTFIAAVRCKGGLSYFRYIVILQWPTVHCKTRYTRDPAPSKENIFTCNKRIYNHTSSSISTYCEQQYEAQKENRLHRELDTWRFDTLNGVTSLDFSSVSVFIVICFQRHVHKVSQKPSYFKPSYFQILMTTDVSVCVAATRLSECK
jgi:hypothetical protein